VKKALYITYFVCAIVLFNVYYTLQTDHRIILPSLMNKQELTKCNKMKPEYFSMLVIEESKIYWKTRNNKVVCVKSRVD
jgi:hypothetical protein